LNGVSVILRSVCLKLTVAFDGDLFAKPTGGAARELRENLVLSLKELLPTRGVLNNNLPAWLDMVFKLTKRVSFRRC